MMWLSARALLVAVMPLLLTDVWAAGGWYLLIPPRSEYNERADLLSGYKILDTKPLSKWSQEGAYDSASDCEAARRVLLDVEQRNYYSSSDLYKKALGSGADPTVLKAQRWTTEAQNANVGALTSSRCISIHR